MSRNSQGIPILPGLKDGEDVKGRTYLVRVGLFAACCVLAAGLPTVASASADAMNGKLPALLHRLAGLSSDGNFADASANTASKKAEEKSSLRRKAQREAALALGAQGGLYYEMHWMGGFLASHQSLLDRINFRPLMITDSAGRLIQPPVILESQGAVHVGDKGRLLHLASQTYEIVVPARFVSVPPTWRDYLQFSQYKEPEQPAAALLPRIDQERVDWTRWVTRGWQTGVQQAFDIQEMQIAKMQRDYIGMIRYRLLRLYNMVSAPKVDRAYQAVSGGGDKLAINDTVLKIRVLPGLNRHSGQWRALPELPDVDYLNLPDLSSSIDASDGSGEGDQ